MNPEAYRALQALFVEASKLAGDERRAFLDTHCADAETRRQVERLLAADAREGGLFDTPAPDGAAGAIFANEAPLPEKIGAYRVLRRLGEGGMGAVYAAEQDHPRRTVALKVLHPGLMTPAMTRRFEFEGEVLAQLQHPGIAHIHEAGTASVGGATLPFFAMELVVGVPITKHADQHELDVRARLELVARVADALEHAHRKGIIHRDLKPQNVLVDASGQPKILDFGIARATELDGRSPSLVTQSGMLVGTLAYMSPEQAGADARALDTRSDVYSLGVLAYELLTGRLPYDVAELPLPRAVRVVTEDEPVRPSTIHRRLRGDVETILLKALEKDKERRYGSAAEFAADVRAYLGDEPIRARPASTFYQASKFARRHKGLVAGLAATFLALVVGLVVSIAFYWKSEESLVRAETAAKAESNQRAIAEQAAASEAAERKRAQRAAERAESTNRFFVVEMMSAPDPWAPSGKDVTVASILDRIEGKISTSFANEPELEADAQITIAKSFLARGIFDKGLEHAERALELRRGLHTGDHPDLADAYLVVARARAERGALVQAEADARAALDAYRRMPDTPSSTRIDAVRELARIQQARGDHASALAGFQDVLEAQIAAHGEEHPATAQALSDLVSVRVATGDGEEALRGARRTLALRRRIHAKDSPYVALSLNDLAAILFEVRDKAAQDEVVALTQESGEILTRKLGPEHRLTLLTRRNHANALVNVGRVAEAEVELREVLEHLPQAIGVEHPDYSQTLNSHGYTLFLLERLDDAEAQYLRAIEAAEKVLGPNHNDTLRPMSNLAYLEKKRGLATGKKRASDGVYECPPGSDLARSLEHFQRVYEGFTKLFGAEHEVVASVTYGYADLLDLVGGHRESAATFGEHARTLLLRKAEDYESTVTQILFRQGMALLKADAAAEAEPVLRDAVERSRGQFPDKDWRTAMSLGALGECLTRTKKFDEAEKVLLECHESFERVKAKRAADFARARKRLADLYDALGKPDSAQPYRETP